MPTSPAQAAKTLTALSDAKFLNLDASLRALVHPAGMGGMSVGNPVADDGPAILIHENFVIIHVGSREILRDDSTALTDGLSRLSANSKLGPPNAIGKAIEKVEELLSYGGRDPTGW